jgi:hypothetical protein
MATVKSCMMIEALIYGIIPRANMDIRERAPPAKIFIRPKAPV